MEQWIISIMDNYGYFGIFLLMLLENVFPPVPSEVVLTAGGFMTSTTSLTVWGVILTATAGSVAGAVMLYGLGLLLDVERVEQIIDKHGHWLRLKKADLYKADRWFDRFGVFAVFIGRLIPLVRSLISIPAGMSNMKFVLFLAFTTAGTLIWNTVLVYIGRAVGENREEILAQLDIYSNIVYALLFAGAIVGLWLFKKRRSAGR
ncbi:alkaline phosphatase [Planococcus rifietoensis]|uniref:Alkaline phosphatase n=1 Tax=Planococcus rifietoensis TaxID=200991 RepID=A0A0U2QAM0_9BACL|nr:DedA family protein [Planococcus rifietoensis]ALS76150.1 alkaline phosphatase [Planococcus rifietoensis]